MMKCVICGIDPDCLEYRIEQEWIPYFFENESEHGPVCPFCKEKLIGVGIDGEFELKEEFQGKIIYHEEDLDGDLWEDVVLGYILN